MIKSFFSRFKKQKKKVVEKGKLWHCTKCKLIFLTESASEKHQCVEQEVTHGKV